MRNNRRKWKAPAKVLEYLKGERQWRRSEKIGNAQYQLRAATSNTHKRFWEDVLRALGARVPGRVAKFPQRHPKPAQGNVPAALAA